MYNHVLRGKRDILQSVDYLVYCHIAYIYFLDTSFLLLFFRLVLQTHLLSAREGNTQSSVSFFSILFVFFLSAMLHVSSIFGQSGIIIDFIGSQHPPNLLRLCFLDVFIVSFQLIRLFISQQHFENSPNELPVQLLSSSSPLTSVLEANNHVHTPNTSLTSPAIGQRRRRFTATEADRDDNSSSLVVTDSDDAFHHNNIVIGLSISHLIQCYRVSFSHPLTHRSHTAD
ncbi:hypothetical protein BC941DRAFT_441330 [Chlamydoabsidia padenii]|nr:hypothetical protein BC941DRAFT_441330 [Chlamydoabsidia padenii]